MTRKERFLQAAQEIETRQNNYTEKQFDMSIAPFKGTDGDTLTPNGYYDIAAYEAQKLNTAIRNAFPEKWQRPSMAEMVRWMTE